MNYGISPLIFNFSFTFLFFFLIQGNHITAIRKLLHHTKNAYPGIVIRAAVPEELQMGIQDEQIAIDLFKDKMDLKGHQSTLPTSEGFVWTQLVSNVSTPYIFAAIDLLYVDPIDVNMIRMVRTIYHVCTLGIK